MKIEAAEVFGYDQAVRLDPVLDRPERAPNEAPFVCKLINDTPARGLFVRKIALMFWEPLVQGP